MISCSLAGQRGWLVQAGRCSGRGGTSVNITSKLTFDMRRERGHKIIRICPLTLLFHLLIENRYCECIFQQVQIVLTCGRLMLRGYNLNIMLSNVDRGDTLPFPLLSAAPLLLAAPRVHGRLPEHNIIETSQLAVNQCQGQDSVDPIFVMALASSMEIYKSILSSFFIVVVRFFVLSFH